MFKDLRASVVWVLTFGLLEVNPKLDSIHAQRGRALFRRVKNTVKFILVKQMQ